jgi:Domain of unknown function (DUF4157)
MAGSDHAVMSERVPDSDTPRRAAAPEQQTGATAAGAAPATAARAVVPSPSAPSLGARQVRAKSVIGAATDPAEREADHAADKALRMAAPEQERPTAVDPTVADATSRGPGAATSIPPGIQRSPADPAASAPVPASAAQPPIPTSAPRPAPAPPSGPASAAPIRSQAVADHDPHGGQAVPTGTEGYLDQSQGTGSPLPDGTRRYFETRFSTDFHAVRVHDDAAAGQAAQSIGALAFTRGRDMWFSAGAYDTGTDGGRQLLAHELAHVAQQNPGIGRVEQRPGQAAAGPAPGTKAGATQSVGRHEGGETAAQISALSRVALQRDPGALPPGVNAWLLKVNKGGQGEGQPRDLASDPAKVFVGDHLLLCAEFPKLTPEQRQQIKPDDFFGGTAAFVAAGPTWDGNRLTWDVQPTSVGSLSAQLEASATVVEGATADLGQHAQTFEVVIDLIDFIMAVQSAQSQILSKFAAASKQINLAALTFRQAQADQDAALTDVAKTEKLTDDLLWGAFFAAVGGGVGGEAGRQAKKIFEGWQVKSPEGLTDLCKDTVKFAVRSLDRMRGGKPATQGDSTAPPTLPTAKPGGARSAQGENPFDFLTRKSAEINGDTAMVQDNITKLVENARHARSVKSKADFNEDPIATAAKGLVQLDAIITGLDTEKTVHLKKLWKTWIEKYAYTIHTSYLRGVGPRESLEEGITGKVHDAIMKAAKQCGENGDDWIREFGDPIKAEREAEVAEFNRPKF